nr:transglycosylase domain-containing protein [Kineosporia mesophila]
MAQVGPMDRQNAALEQVPSPVRLAVLAAEDQTFYSNHGFKLTSIARAALSSVSGTGQGGSTITQQTVKNLYDRREHSLGRKASELLLAVKLDRQMSKDEILGRYLNTIYWGRGAYGVQAAAQTYFHCDADDLTLAQGALLAGIINSPEAADPHDGGRALERARRRWNVVLDAMVGNGSLPVSERERARWPRVYAPQQSNTLGGQTGYLVTMVENEVREKLHISDEEFRTGGYRITSTFDSGLERAAVRAVEKSLPRRRTPKHLQVGLVSVDSQTGAVRALYGGADFLKRQQNAATQDTAEAAGVIAPFALAAGLRNGWSPGDTVGGPRRYRVGRQLIENFRGKHYPALTVGEAGAYPVNTALARLISPGGAGRVQKVTEAAGIPRSARVGASVTNALGGAAVHPIDVAQAYATLASGGVRHEPYVVQTVTRMDEGPSRVLLERGDEPAGHRVFPASLTADVDSSLRLRAAAEPDALDGTRGISPVPYFRRVRAEIFVQGGTSSSYRSAWFAGYSARLSTAVDLYQLSRDGREVERMEGFGKYSHITADGYPADVWSSFMAAAHRDDPVPVTTPQRLG